VNNEFRLCEECGAFRPNSFAHGASGECHRFAPRPMMLAGEDQVPDADWPLINCEFDPGCCESVAQSEAQQARMEALWAEGAWETETDARMREAWPLILQGAEQQSMALWEAVKGCSVRARNHRVEICFRSGTALSKAKKLPDLVLLAAIATNVMGADRPQLHMVVTR
jgi:hypothetical protein